MELDDLNPAQRLAVTHAKGPILVVAGAGTGKTQVITRRIAYLILKRRIPAEQILALTFTERAAREMEGRLDLLLPYGQTATKVMTFNAFGDDLLRRFGIEIGLDPGFRVMSQSQQLVWLHDHLDNLKLHYYAPIGQPTGFLGDLARYFGRLKEELVEPAAYSKWAKSHQRKVGAEPAARLEVVKQLELANSYKIYQSQTRVEGLIDFNDQVTLALELLRQRPNVLATLRGETSYILVDEFQDTNLAQAELLAELAGRNGNIMAVGDDDQSIYKFRGAAISNILSFRERYPKAETVVLTENYRSTQSILDSAYKLITHNNPERLEAKYQIDKHLTSSRRGSQPQVVYELTWRDEADAIAVDIVRRLKDGAAAADIAVLLRKRNQAQILINAFNRASIPHHYQGDDTIYNRPEVKVLMYFLQQIIDPRDDVSLYHLLSSEVFNLDMALLGRASSLARRRNVGLAEILATELSDGKSAELEHFLKLNQRWREATKSLTVGQLSYDFLVHSGYLKHLTDLSQTDPLAELKVSHIAKFFKQLENYEAIARDPSTYGFVANLPSLERSGATSAAEADPFGQAVQILTIHQSKGLEFDTVYIFDLTRGTFPSSRRAERIELPDELLRGERLVEGDWHLAEERRLMYVAMTRAKTSLVASFSSDHGTVQPKKPSPFLAEAFGYDATAAVRPAPRSALQQIELFAGQDSLAPLRPSFLKGENLELTPHQIDDYLLCPLNFYWLYVLEVPQPLRPALAYGSLIHQVISYYFEQRRAGKVTLAQLDRLIDQLWRGEGYPSRGQAERQQAQAHTTIKSFWRREETAGRLPAYTEKSFHFEAAPQVMVNGRFDAVYVDGKIVEIRDFKTSQVSDTETADKRAAASVQLAVYGLAWSNLMGQIPTTLTLDYVETGQIGKATQTAADQAELVASITQIAANLRAGLYPPGKSHFYCIHDKL